MSNDSISSNKDAYRSENAELIEHLLTKMDALGSVPASDFDSEIPSSDLIIRKWKNEKKQLQCNIGTVEATSESKIRAKMYLPEPMGKDEFLDILTASARILPPTPGYMERAWEQVLGHDHVLMSDSAASKINDVVARLIQERSRLLDLAGGTISAITVERDSWKQLGQDSLIHQDQLTYAEKQSRAVIASARSLIESMKHELEATRDELTQLKAQKAQDENASSQMMAAHVHMYSAAAWLISQFPPLADLAGKIQRSLKVDKYEVPTEDITIYIYVAMLTGVPMDTIIGELSPMLLKSKTHSQILTRVARKLLYNEQPAPLLPAVDRAVSKYLRDCEPKNLGEGVLFKDVSPAAVIVSLFLPHLADIVRPLNRAVCVEIIEEAKDRAIRAQSSVKELLRYTLLSGATVPQNFELPKMPDTTHWAFYATEWAKFVYVGEPTEAHASNKGDAVPAGDDHTSSEVDTPVTHI